MKDDVLEHLGKSIAIMAGGFLFLYLMIVATQDHPIGIAIIIVRTTEAIAKWLFWFAVSVATFFFALSGIEFYRIKRCKDRERKQMEELAKQEKSRAIEKEKERLEELTILEERQKIESVIALKKEQERLLADEDKLKTRSAEDAVNEALKHFM